jgi:hypothetical protein
MSYDSSRAFSKEIYTLYTFFIQQALYKMSEF